MTGLQGEGGISDGTGSGTISGPAGDDDIARDGIGRGGRAEDAQVQDDAVDVGGADIRVGIGQSDDGTARLAGRREDR